jgi:UDP-N-acetylmuramoyl-L-alanyl-D-glutamate--2,6-diaminopimelate ligase
MKKNLFRRKFRNSQHLLESAIEVIKYGYPAKKLKVIGVTGTDGKTTTCHLIYEILKTAGKKVALVSTVAAYIGDQEIDTGFHVTTPDAKVLQPLIKRVADAGTDYLILEVTSHSLDQHRVLGCNFWIGVLTNVTHEHLDYHKSFESYRATKAKLFSGVKYAVLNQDDPSFSYFQDHTSGKVIPYTRSEVKTNLIGEYNQYNLGAALVVAKLAGIENKLKVFSGVPGRMEEVKLGQKFRAIVDFAHTPNALEKLLTQLRMELPRKKKLILVFGCAGLRDMSKRPLMGEFASKLADYVIITAEDPRTESLDDIYDQINCKSGIRIDDRQKAIEKATQIAQPGDIVVVAGKGHEKSMCFGTNEYSWSDREALTNTIKQKLK